MLSQNPQGHDTRSSILVVDSDESTRALLSELCESWDFNVTLAGDGNQAVELLLGQKPDLCLLDLAMPGRDGFSVLKWLRENERLRELPVIALTRADGLDEVVRAMDLGADDFVAKPLRLVELQTRINAALTVHRYRHRVERASLREEAPSTRLASTTTLAASFDKELMHSRRYGQPTACLVFNLEEVAASQDALAEGFYQGALSSLRGVDRLFRSEANEFVALLPQTDREGARQVAQRILEAVTLQNSGLQVRCGEAAFPGRGLRTSADLLREARAVSHTSKC